MHQFKIPQYIVDRVVRRRGKEHIFDDLDPATTALIVVDLQNGFMVEEYAVNVVPEAVAIVPNVNRLAQAVRDTGGKVFWIRNTVTEESERGWSEMTAMNMAHPEQVAKRTAAFQENAMGHRLYPDLTVKPEDETVLKYRYSAFVQGSSDLHERLRAGGYRTLLITGTVTGVCCESTARDAMMLNYRSVMVSDGNAARTDDEHNASLTSFYATFGDVMDTDMLVKCLHANRTENETGKSGSRSPIGAPPRGLVNARATAPSATGAPG